MLRLHLNSFDDQKRSPTLVNTDFQVLKFKFNACNFKQAFYPFQKLYIAWPWKYKNTFMQAFRSIPGCQTCIQRGISHPSRHGKSICKFCIYPLQKSAMPAWPDSKHTVPFVIFWSLWCVLWIFLVCPKSKLTSTLPYCHNLVLANYVTYSFVFFPILGDGS